MPGFTRIYAKVEKINQLSEEKLRGKDWQQICEVQKTCRYTKHLHSLPKRAKHKKNSFAEQKSINKEYISEGRAGQE